jgi:DNA-binding NtrC family response regulator
MSDKKRILFVDDDELILSCFQRLLSRRFDVEVADGSAQGLIAVESKGPYSIVVTDMNMPGMNGLELLARARQVCPATIGILMSGNADADAVDQAVRDGIVSRVMNKPFPANQLINVLEEILSEGSIALEV